VVGVNVAAFALQVAGLWLSTLRLVFPGATLTVHNSLHPFTGLTSSTADLACVLAITLPLCAPQTLVLAAGAIVLVWTSAFSGIVAGAVGLLVAFWPRIKATGREWLIGWSLVGLMACGIACERVGGEIGAAVVDARWTAWSAALGKWFATAPGSTPGSIAMGPSFGVNFISICFNSATRPG
jgi:hypothetical protein